MTSLEFTKMHGLGNDFVVFDGVRQRVELSQVQIRMLADRRLGVGCDQVLMVERALGDSDFRYRIFNADGGEVEQCGNGARCFLVFVRARGLTDKRELRVETSGGIIAPRLTDDGRVAVAMGRPRFRAEEVPFVGGEGAIVEPLEVDGKIIQISALSMGNPHAVQVVPDLDAAPVGLEGPAIELHPRFPQRVNAGYMQIIDRANIRLRVWERGAGETPACGTGACAAVVAGIRRNVLDPVVRVLTRGGELVVEWSGSDREVTMTGPAEAVFEGTWSPPRALSLHD